MKDLLPQLDGETRRKPIMHIGTPAVLVVTRLTQKNYCVSVHHISAAGVAERVPIIEHANIFGLDELAIIVRRYL